MSMFLVTDFQVLNGHEPLTKTTLRGALVVGDHAYAILVPDGKGIAPNSSESIALRASFTNRSNSRQITDPREIMIKSV